MPNITASDADKLALVAELMDRWTRDENEAYAHQHEDDMNLIGRLQVQTDQDHETFYDLRQSLVNLSAEKRRLRSELSITEQARQNLVRTYH